jgi:phage tail-like protein
MTSIFSDDALHPGRDPNDSSWKILRRPHDWQGAILRDTKYDAGRMVIELAPRGLGPGDDSCGECTPGEMTYRCDPERHVVLAGPCGCELRPLPHLGGYGTATGRLRRPTAVAVDDRGLLYVADADNHRVQVVRPDDGSVVIVLGATDGWGEPLAGLDGGAMTEPVAIAVGASAIYIADRRGGRVHVYDRAFRWQRSFEATPAPIAVALDAEGRVLVADASRSRLACFAPHGDALADVPFEDEGPLACLASRARFAPRGDVIVGPIDGLVEDLAWHRVIVDANIPPGCSITVQTYASDDPATPPAMPWAPIEPVKIEAHGGERPVLSDVGRWQRARHGAYRRGSPIVATFTGDGPNGIASLLLSGDGLARARIGDTLELVAAAPSTASERAVIVDIEERVVQLSATGAVQLFGQGTALTLLERGGVEPFGGPRVLYTLAAGEQIDLSTVATDGTLAEVLVPHAAAALWRRGDVIQIGAATILVDDVRATPAVVALAAPLADDYSRSTVRIVLAQDRLLLADATGLDAFVPDDEAIEITGLGAGSPWTRSGQIHWIEPDLRAVWLVPDPLLPWDEWESFTTAPGVATDRGRYLWLRLALTGARAHADDEFASATPTIRSVRLLRPRLSYLRYLPATFSRRDADDPTGALFLERMLAMFERKLTTIESRYEAVSRQLDPFAADPEWLRFIAAWFDLYLDPSIPLERRRLLVAEAHALYAIRGTPEGIRRYIEIVTGESPAIVEGFQMRPKSGLVLGCTGVLGCSALGSNDGAVLDQHAHQFTIFVFVTDPCRLEQVRASMQLLIDSIRPAHTLVDLRVVVPDARVEAQSSVGIDFVLGDGREQPHVLGERGGAGERPHPVLGLDAVLTRSAFQES